MAKVYYYILVTKNGNPVVTDYKLPIYWNKQVAITERIKLCSDSVQIKKIRISDLLDMINYPTQKGVTLHPWQ